MPYDGEDLTNDSGEIEEVFRLVGDFDDAIVAPSVDQIASGNRDFESFADQQCVNGRLEAQGRVDMAGVAGELVVKRTCAAVLEEEQLIQPSAKMVPGAGESHVDPLIDDPEALP